MLFHQQVTLKDRTSTLSASPSLSITSQCDLDTVFSLFAVIPVSPLAIILQCAEVIRNASNMECFCCRRETPFYWSHMHALNTCKPKDGCTWRKVCKFSLIVFNMQHHFAMQVQLVLIRCIHPLIHSSLMCHLYSSLLY